MRECGNDGWDLKFKISDAFASCYLLFGALN